MVPARLLEQGTAIASAIRVNVDAVLREDREKGLRALERLVEPEAEPGGWQAALLSAAHELKATLDRQHEAVSSNLHELELDSLFVSREFQRTVLGKGALGAPTGLERLLKGTVCDPAALTEHLLELATEVGHAHPCHAPRANAPRQRPAPRRKECCIQGSGGQATLTRASP